MVLINEWFPNPTGSDIKGEFVELFNAGANPVDLNGWLLKTGGKSKTKLSGTIGAGKYVVLKRVASKLVLKNTDEQLFLYDRKGVLVDHSAFFGLALEGKSFSRTYAGEQKSQGTGEPFVWSYPTPGMVNTASIDQEMIKNAYPAGIPLNSPFGHVQFGAILLGSSVVLAAIIIYAFKKHEHLSNLFFGRDEEAWQ